MTQNEKIIFSKIVYFDEDTAIDSLEVIDEGQTAKVIHDLDENAKKWGFSGGLSGFFKALNISTNGKYQKQSNTVIEKQITSTILTNFINNIEKKKLQSIRATIPKLKIINESAAYYRNLMPVINMIGDLDKISSEVIENKSQLIGIDFEGMQEMLDTLFAYYELIGEYNGEKAIFRFNIDWLKNNYNLYDLVKMTKLTLFGVQVGSTCELDLSFDNQVSIFTEIDNEENIEVPLSMEDILTDETIKDENKSTKKEIPIIDVILAGVVQ